MHHYLGWKRARSPVYSTRSIAPVAVKGAFRGMQHHVGSRLYSVPQCAVIETLEARTLLSWPAFPFAPGDMVATVYTNQYGLAQAQGRKLTTDHSFEGYAMPVKAGTVRFQTTGPTLTDLAFYSGSGGPRQTDAGAGSKDMAQLSVKIPPSVHRAYWGISAHNGATGSYGFVVRGSKPKLQLIKMSGASGQISSSISGAGDFRFFDFAVPRTGNWTFTLVPSGGLDATMMVFDSAGRVRGGGNYLTPINTGRAGVKETWTGLRLGAGSHYVIRVDGKSAGAFALRVAASVQTQSTTVQVGATQPSASKPGKFTITRSGNLSKPLTVSYSLSGSARNGTDYAKLASSVKIPAGESSTSLSVRPIGTGKAGQTVILTLSAGAGYKIGSRPSATIKLASTIPPTAKWPKGPFSFARITSEIHVDQWGNATIRNQQFKSPTDAKIYLVYFDDPGRMDAQVTGSAQTQMALYMGQKATDPKRTSSPVSGHPHISTGIAGKTAAFLAVKPRGNAHGRFSLEIRGVRHRVVRAMFINQKSYSATWMTDISNAFDADFYQFTAPVSGTWRVTMLPQGKWKGMDNLNATLNVYDTAGNPIGGTCTRPIDTGGDGVAESWTSSLSAGTQIFARIDGATDSTGWYHIRLDRLGPPIIHASTSTPGISEFGTKAGQFLIKRTGTHDMSKPVRVHYAISGTAINGADYAPINSSVVIRAGMDSAKVYIKAIYNPLLQGARTVSLTLLEDESYTLSSNTAATVTIYDA